MRDKFPNKSLAEKCVCKTGVDCCAYIRNGVDNISKFQQKISSLNHNKNSALIF